MREREERKSSSLKDKMKKEKKISCNLKKFIVEFSTVNFYKEFSTTLANITCCNNFEGLKFGNSFRSYTILINLRCINYKESKFPFPNDDNLVISLRKDNTLRISNFSKYFSKWERTSAIVSKYKYYNSFLVLSEF